MRCRGQNLASTLKMNLTITLVRSPSRIAELPIMRF
jgi:hypothetical protein